MVKDQYPEAVSEATGTILPVWLDAFKVLLNIDPRQDVENTSDWDGLSIRVQVFKVNRPQASRCHKRYSLISADPRYYSPMFPTSTDSLPS